MGKWEVARRFILLCREKRRGKERERFVRINKRSSKRNRSSFETALYMLCPLRFGFEHSSFQVCKSGGTRGFYGRHGGLAEENGFRLFLFARGRRTRVIKSISRALSACPASRKIAESSFHEVQLPGRSTRGEAMRAGTNPQNLRNARLRFLLP